MLNKKTIILLNLVEYPLILGTSAYGLFRAIFQDNCSLYDYLYVLLTIIPRARVGYEMIDSQRGA